MKSQSKMRWITKEELERDLNELLPDKDVCDLIMLYILIKIYFERVFVLSLDNTNQDLDYFGHHKNRI